MRALMQTAPVTCFMLPHPIFSTFLLPTAIGSVGAIFSFNRAGWSVSVVAFGDRKDFLQVLRMWHFRRKCHMRKTCKRDAGRGSVSACTGLLLPQSQKSLVRSLGYGHCCVCDVAPLFFKI